MNYTTMIDDCLAMDFDPESLYKSNLKGKYWYTLYFCHPQRGLLNRKKIYSLIKKVVSVYEINIKAVIATQANEQADASIPVESLFELKRMLEGSQGWRDYGCWYHDEFELWLPKKSETTSLY